LGKLCAKWLGFRDKQEILNNVQYEEIGVPHLATEEWWPECMKLLWACRNDCVVKDVLQNKFVLAKLPAILGSFNIIYMRRPLCETVLFAARRGWRTDFMAEHQRLLDDALLASHDARIQTVHFADLVYNPRFVSERLSRWYGEPIRFKPCMGESFRRKRDETEAFEREFVQRIVDGDIEVPQDPE